MPCPSHHSDDECFSIPFPYEPIPFCSDNLLFVLPSARTICGKVVDNGFSDGYTQYFGKISSLDCRHAQCGLKGCPPLP